MQLFYRHCSYPLHGIRPTLTGFLSINTSIAKQGKQRVHQVPVPDSGDLNLFQRTSGTVMFPNSVTTVFAKMLYGLAVKSQIQLRRCVQHDICPALNW